MPVIVERNGVRVNLSILLPPESANYWLTRTGATLIFFRLAQLMPLIMSLFIVWRRPRDPRALALAWFLATCAVFIIALPYRFATVWRGMPILLRELFWIPYFSALTIGPILLTFVTVFPTRLPYAGYVQAGTWAVAGAAVASPLYHATQLIYLGTELRQVGPRNLLLLGVMTASLLAAVALIVWHYRRTTDLNDRRRLGVVVLGIAFSALPGFLAVVYSGCWGTPIKHSRFSRRHGWASPHWDCLLRRHPLPTQSFDTGCSRSASSSGKGFNTHWRAGRCSPWCRFSRFS